MRALTARPDLEIRIRAGHGGLDRTVRWAHVTELHDPVRWLRGGELVLTVGLNVGATEAEQRAYVARLDTAGCAGLGFALDTWLTEIPPAMVDEASGAVVTVHPRVVISCAIASTTISVCFVKL